jgi:hypothetical protein
VVHDRIGILEMLIMCIVGKKEGIKGRKEKKERWKEGREGRFKASAESKDCKGLNMSQENLAQLQKMFFSNFFL